MQRIRETDHGLQVTQDMDVLTFTPNTDDTGVTTHLKNSALDSALRTSRFFIIEGKDNMRDLGEWFARLQGNEAETASFNPYTVSPYESVAAVSTLRPQPPEEEDRSDLSREIYELTVLTTVLLDLIEELAPGIERPPAPIDADMEAFAYPLGVPNGLTPIMLARQTADLLTLQFDRTHLREAMPMGAAQKFGEWVIEGIDTIKKKSVWG